MNHWIRVTTIDKTTCDIRLDHVSCLTDERVEGRSTWLASVSVGGTSITVPQLEIDRIRAALEIERI